ncbi:hypothetical protein CBR_g20259 [Chara braunii]|uniref:Uncharacterized protein n=1 Tax=Chara braunii TaxID=69332 RepID=A0A388KZZ5_CHABU|nr:hypothetical protein CBR_g20259 [Chara braunii]|eukprot:GBG75629.1 hypothetical protein CBR_g20259 [Chara braunii]
MGRKGRWGGRDEVGMAWVSEQRRREEESRHGMRGQDGEVREMSGLSREVGTGRSGWETRTEEGEVGIREGEGERSGRGGRDGRLGWGGRDGRSGRGGGTEVGIKSGGDARRCRDRGSKGRQGEVGTGRAGWEVGTRSG